jgi:hypothetical protein
LAVALLGSSPLKPLLTRRIVDALMYVVEKIYRVKRFGKMIEDLDAENTEGDDDENFRGITPLYIRLRQHQNSDEGSRTTLGCICSPRPQHDALAPG